MFGQPPQGAPRRLLLLLLAACLAAAAAGRRLAQQEPGAAAAAPAAEAGTVAAAAPASEPAAANASDAAATDAGHVSPYGSPEADACIQLTNSAGQACTVESDTLSLHYSRGSEQLPTPEETAAAIAAMQSAAQPAASCCRDFKPYADARCPCDPQYQQILPIGGFDPNYFIGATAILAQACGFDFPLCKPGEVAKPPADLVAKAANGGR